MKHPILPYMPAYSGCFRYGNIHRLQSLDKFQIILAHGLQPFRPGRSNPAGLFHALFGCIGYGSYRDARARRRSGRTMRKFFKRTLIVFLSLASLAALWWWNYPINSMRYRLTVEVEADGKVHTGSSVNELQVLLHPYFLDMKTFDVHFRGEALMVDLGPRGTLLMLLTGERRRPTGGFEMDPYGLAPRRLGFKITDPKDVRWLQFLKAGPVEIPTNKVPMMVRYRDIADPATIEMVDPMDLEASFGPGVHLLRVTIETTRDPVTTGIYERLPWLVAPRRGYLSGLKQFDPAQPEPEKYLDAYVFARGTRK